MSEYPEQNIYGLSPQQIDRAQRAVEETGEPLECVLASLGIVSEQDISRSLAENLSAPLIQIADFLPAIDFDANNLSPMFLRQHRMLPLGHSEDGSLIIVTAVAPTDEILRAVEYATSEPITLRVATLSELAAAHDKLEKPADDGELIENSEDDTAAAIFDDTERLRDLASEAPVIQMVNRWINDAVARQASDIHIEPAESVLRLRFRLDGALVDIEQLDRRHAAAVTSRLKILARLDIAERRLPQDGKFRMAVRGHAVDIRVSTIPTLYGESIVLRLLDRDRVELKFARLGLEGLWLERFRTVLSRPNGILLVTGPTGSGKTTTLYAALSERKNPEIKILSVEDPVEYELDGIDQTQVQPQIGLTFANALRSFLRHDPDVILVGEIRDVETARISVQAALTGHLVLSTLHTNDAVSAITRLQDMGVEDYLIASTIGGVAAQRLVRKLCPHCRSAYEAGDGLAASFGVPSDEVPFILYRAEGCDHCGGTGYSGRLAIAEMLVMSDPLRDMIARNMSGRNLLSVAQNEGMVTMQADGMAKCRAGLTTIEEVLRVTTTV